MPESRGRGHALRGARAESWCPGAAPQCGALRLGPWPWGSPAAGERERVPWGTGNASQPRPYLVRDLPSESHPCSCGGEKSHVEHSGCRCGRAAVGPCHGGALSRPRPRRAPTAPCPDRPPQLPWHSSHVRWPRFAPTHVAKHSQHIPFTFCYVGGEKEKTT